MKEVSNIIIFVVCLILTYQDFRHKYIEAGYVLLLFSSLAVHRIQDLSLVISVAFLNILFLTILLVVLFLYIRIKYGQRKLVNRHIGLGDILVFIVFTLAFNLHNYVLFLCSGCVLGLVYWIWKTKQVKNAAIRIPLAGILTGYYFIIGTISSAFSFDPIKSTILQY